MCISTPSRVQWIARDSNSYNHYTTGETELSPSTPHGRREATHIPPDPHPQAAWYLRNAIAPQKLAEPQSRPRISVDDIGEPRLDPAYLLKDLITANDEKRPQRPPRPGGAEMRPPVVRDPQERGSEGKTVRAVRIPKRPERPREEDLPYGAKGSVPIQDAKSPGPSRAVFSPFAPLGRSTSVRSARARMETGAIGGPSLLATRPKRKDGVVTIPPEQARPREGKGKERASREEVAASVYCAPNEPATVRRQGAIRRSSKASLPPMDLRDRLGGSEDTLVGSPQPHASLHRSQSLATRATPKPMPSPSPSILFRTPRPEPRDVPRDVRSRFPHDSLFLSGSSHAEPVEHEEPMLIPPAPVATRRLVEKAQANMPLRCPPAPRDVKLTAPDPQRASSCRAEVGRVATAAAPPPTAGPSSTTRSRSRTVSQAARRLLFQAFPRRCLGDRRRIPCG
ncbi:hypothetical protein C8Q77DRAFT_1097372 [Trametes polyzona]|nr:hypothetical protein C8Q77DRAFT_1097372 [Trametes polyzona]